MFHQSIAFCPGPTGAGPWIASAAWPGRHAALAGRRVLVVEDEPLVALDICLVLEDLGCRAVGPASGLEMGLHLARREPLDAALLDENLGLVLVTPVAEALEARGVPFAIVSGHTRSLSHSVILTNAPRLPKPARTARIAETLLTLVGQR